MGDAVECPETLSLPQDLCMKSIQGEEMTGPYSKKNFPVTFWG